ncbi:hypothetical protein K457DRAFT_736670 [Linnemannia elongata AG-77]|uniref:Uncharacterized protein n=1 Tax=Linnemannia elongata AG-77 TaxID=1314771 RepID=A0A197JLB3_9FUNG|nr:hypothetical protein K457DRAFT_736670 [Linnemannia elongata AG-77]
MPSPTFFFSIISSFFLKPFNSIHFSHFPIVHTPTLKKSIIFPYVCIHIMHYCLPFSPSFSFPLPPSSEPSPLFLSLCQTIFGVLFPSVHLRKTRKRKRIRNIYIHPDSVHLWIPFPFLLVLFYILLPHTQQQ